MHITLISLSVPAFAASVLAHCSFLSIYGSNDRVGHGFGVVTTGEFPRHMGEPGDAGGDSGVFQTGTNNPSPACGNTPQLGELDIPAWLSQAEGLGLPAAHPNGSIVVDAFQVNRDGGGPMSCQYSSDATATSWRDMTLSYNQVGQDGINDVQRTNYTLVMNFPDDAQCTGGWTQTACIVRCRTGVNKRFGGCFAVKLSGSNSYAVQLSTSSTSGISARSPTQGLNEAQKKTKNKQTLETIRGHTSRKLKKSHKHIHS